MKKNAVAVSPVINRLLNELLAVRVDDNPHMVHSKVAIVAELIHKAHKKEVK